MRNNPLAFAAAMLAVGNHDLYPHQQRLAVHLDRLNAARTDRQRAAVQKRNAMRDRHAGRKDFFARVRAQAGFTTRECEQLTRLANKHGKSFGDVAAEARRLREFG